MRNDRALNSAYYRDYAGQLAAQAQQVCAEHRGSTWTGCCLACGRPAPCDEQIDAELLLTGRGRWATNGQSVFLSDPAASYNRGPGVPSRPTGQF